MIASGDLSNRCRPTRARGGEGPARPAAGADPRRSREPRHPVHPARARHEPVGALRGRLRHHRSRSPYPERRRLRAQLGPSVASSGRPARPAATGVGRADPGRCPGRRAADRRLPPPPRRRALARLAEVPAQAPRHGAAGRSRRREPSSCSGGTSTRHGGRATRVPGARRRRSRARSCSPPHRASGGRVRDRLGEANGLHVVRWTADEIEIETRIWRSGSFEAACAKRAPAVIRGCYSRRTHGTMRRPLEHFWRGVLRISTIAPSDDGLCRRDRNCCARRGRR